MPVICPEAGDPPLCLVIGAGAAGMGCAIAAARGGARVILVERDARHGGTVAGALIHTLGGLFDGNGDLANAGIPAELIQRLEDADPQTSRRRIGRIHVLNADPETYRETTGRWLDEESRISRLYGAEIAEVSVEAKRIRAISFKHGLDTCTIHPTTVVDATGNASVVRHIDPDLVEAGEALAGLVVHIRGTAPDALAFPKSVGLIKAIRAGVKSGLLPASCATLWPDSGVRRDEVYFKFNLLADAHDGLQLSSDLRRLMAWLRDIPGFADATIATIGELGIRDGGRIRGAYRLCEGDLMGGRRFPDAVCRGSWPIEHWHPDKGITLDYLPPGTLYDIPLRALQIGQLDNLYVVGKHLSAEPRAQASARVAGTCWAMGAGLGRTLTTARSDREMLDA